MSEFSRKDFLRLSSWGLVAALLPVDRIYALDGILSKSQVTIADFEQAKSLASQAKQKFYLKNYNDAEALYMQAITLAPNYIQFYDGLDNVFGAQNRFLDSVQLFKNALLINPSNVAFYDRAARSLMRLQTGCRSLASEYRTQINSASLLYDAANLYESAIAIDSSKLYLNIGLAKINAKINIAPLEDNFKVNRVFKNLKRLNKNIYKEALNSKSNEQIRELINRVDNKKRRELLTSEEIVERKINMLLQKKKFYDILQKRENITELEKIEYVERLFRIDYKDSNSLRKIKIVYYTNNKFFEFIEVRRKFADATKTFSGYIGLMDAMEIAYRKGQASSNVLDEALAIGAMLRDQWSLMFERKVDLAIKMSKIMLLQSNFSRAKELLEDIIPKVKLDSYSINNKLIHYYSKIHFHEGDLDFVKNSLLIGVKELDLKYVEALIAENPKYLLVKHLADNKQKDVFKNNLDLYYLLYNTYFIANKTDKANEIINRLLTNNPLDSFVTSRT